MNLREMAAKHVLKVLDPKSIEIAAVYTVGLYINKCHKLVPDLRIHDKIPFWDGDIFIYKKEECYNNENFFARTPVQIKGTMSRDCYYRIERNYLEKYKDDKGCIFFMVQVDDSDSFMILYALLDSDTLTNKLKSTTKTIVIDLNPVPRNLQVFENEVIEFAAKRKGVEYEKSITSKPRVFLSYSWENRNNASWVEKLATDLVKNGIDLIFDKWDLSLGCSISSFIERSISTSDKVICILTQSYQEKLENKKGWFNLEYSIILSQFLTNKDNASQKFIPVWRSGDLIVSNLDEIKIIDMRDDAQYETSLNNLIKACQT